MLDDCARRFTGQVVERIPTGDHVGFLLVPMAVESRPLPFQSVRSLSPGHEA